MESGGKSRIASGIQEVIRRGGFRYAPHRLSKGYSPPRRIVALPFLPAFCQPEGSKGEEIASSSTIQ